MTKPQDPDLATLSLGRLRREVMRLRGAIRAHRHADENRRCWHNDLVLYGVLPEDIPPGKMVGLEEDLLRNCRRYIRRQQCERHGCSGVSQKRKRGG